MVGLTMIKLILRNHTFSSVPGGTFDDVKIINEAIVKNTDITSVIYDACRMLNASTGDLDDILISSDDFTMTINGDGLILGNVQYLFDERKRSLI
jgi:hypothetical protein